MTASVVTGPGGVAGTLKLIQVTNPDGRSWLGVEASELAFDLAFAPLTVKVSNGSLAINDATNTTKVSWVNATTAYGLPFDLATVDADVNLIVSGDASIEFDGLLTVEGSFTLTQQDIDPLVTTAFGADATATTLDLRRRS